MQLAEATVGMLYKEVKLVRKELKELRGSLVPLEQISKEEHAELDAILAESSGNEKNWREVLKK